MQRKIVKLTKILEKQGFVIQLKALLGATKEFNEKEENFLKKIAIAICKETGLVKEEAMGLPVETKFSSKEVLDSFKKYEEWLSTQHPDLK